MAIALLGGQRGARAAPQYLPDLPDFYQHQLAGSNAANGFNYPGNIAGYTDPVTPSYNPTQFGAGGSTVQWERNGGWCQQTAFTDAFYQLDRHGAGQLFNHGGVHTWLERMVYAIGDQAIHIYNFDGAGFWTIDQYINHYVQPGTVAHDIYTWNAAAGLVQKNGVNTTYTSMYTLYRDQIAAGHDAVARITNPAGFNALWWWSGPGPGNFHRLAGAGFDDATNTIYFADPNDRNHGAATANWGFPYAAGAALPVGAANYGSNTLAADGTFGGAGDYNGCLVTQFDVFYVVPEPNAGLLVVVAVGLFAGGRAARRRLRPGAAAA